MALRFGMMRFRHLAHTELKTLEKNYQIDARRPLERKHITGRTGMSLARNHEYSLAGVNEVEFILSMGRLRITANRRVKLN